VDPDAIHDSREALRRSIGEALPSDLLAAHRSDGASGHDLSPAAKGIRRLRSVALGYVAAADQAQGAELAKTQFDRADNMTDRQGALAILVSLDAPQRQAALNAFYDRFRDDPLVLDTNLTTLDPGLLLSGQLQKFGYDAATGQVVVEYDGALSTAGGSRVDTRRFVATAPADGTAASVGPALNRAANQVAREVAGWIGG
jgi:hypothetical protein